MSLEVKVYSFDRPTTVTAVAPIEVGGSIISGRPSWNPTDSSAGDPFFDVRSPVLTAMGLAGSLSLRRSSDPRS